MDIDQGYPTIERVDSALAQIVALVPEHKRPTGMPVGPRDAAWWMREHVLDQHHQEESPKRHKSGNGWFWPYMDRCIVHARIFLSMPEAEQNYVLAAREDGVPWRGDDMEIFRLVYDETMRMRKMGADAYRAEAVQKLRGVVRA